MPAARKPKLYKIVSVEFEPIHGGFGLWSKPVGKKPGKWMPKIENVEACQRGYHLIPAKAIVDWLPRDGAALLCEAEGRGESDRDGDKIAFAQARLLKVVGLLDEVSMRLAAADMAERVLPIFYKVRPNDDRPAKAIQAARDLALGKIGAAAWAPARAAAWDAAGAAAKDAAWAPARAAAWAAAKAAAKDAAKDAAGAAAWAAAGAAAKDAAGAAAWAAAWAAAKDAAWDAAWDAAKDAAWAAAKAANAKIILAHAKKRLQEV